MNRLTEGYSPVDRSVEELLSDGWKARDVERPDVAHRKFARALAMSRERGDKQGIGHSLLALANNAAWFHPVPTNDLADTLQLRKELCEEALGVFRELNDERGICKTLLLLGTVPFVQDPSDEGFRDGVTTCQYALEIAQRLGDEQLTAQASIDLAKQLRIGGHKEEAVAYTKQGVEIARELGDKRLLVYGLYTHLFGFDFEGEERLAVYEELFALCRELGQKGDLVRSLLIGAQTADDLPVGRRVEYLREALSVARELGDTSLIQICQATLADLQKDE